MFDSSRDGETFMGATALAVECLLVSRVRENPTASRFLDRPMVVFHHQGEVAWEHRQSMVVAVEFLVGHSGEVLQGVVSECRGRVAQVVGSLVCLIMWLKTCCGKVRQVTQSVA